MERPTQPETIIYGGAFNPPTRAHTAILQACVEFARPTQSEVWVMPSGARLDKAIDVPRERRLQYVRAMIADVACAEVVVRVATGELDQAGMTETYDTVRSLQDQHPGRDFRFVFGADSTQTMALWHRGEELLDTLPMLVVDRPGSVVNPMARHALALSVVTPDVSSTEVRRRIAAGQSVDTMVPESVRALLLRASRADAAIIC